MSRAPHLIKNAAQPAEGFWAGLWEAISALPQGMADRLHVRMGRTVDELWDRLRGRAPRQDRYDRRIAREALDDIEQGRVAVLEGKELRESLSELCGPQFVDDMRTKYGA